METQTEIFEDVDLKKEATIAGKDLTFYWKLVKYPAFLALAFEILAHFSTNTLGLVWLANLILFFYLAWYLFQEKDRNVWQIVTAGVMAGIILGLGMSFFRLVWLHHFFLAFNMITEPVIMGLAGGIISGVSFLGLEKGIKSFQYFKSIIIKL